MLRIETILCRAGIMDNYAYLLIDEKSGIAAVLDPSEVAPIVKRCQELEVKPEYILNTHHHYDHTDGNQALKQMFGAKIVAHARDAHRIEGIDIAVNDGDVFMLGESAAKIIAVDGHTLGHILWYFTEDKALFTGDMLFNLCVGGLFEVTPAQMWESILKIKALPDDVMFYPGHEYTLHGAREALYFSKDKSAAEAYLRRAQDRLQKGMPVAPVSLAEEKKCNPYLSAENEAEFERRLGY